MTKPELRWLLEPEQIQAELEQVHDGCNHHKRDAMRVALLSSGVGWENMLQVRFDLNLSFIKQCCYLFAKLSIVAL